MFVYKEHDRDMNFDVKEQKQMHQRHINDIVGSVKWHRKWIRIQKFG